MVYDVPDHMWVNVAQPARMHPGHATAGENMYFGAGDTCSLVKGGSVEVIGTDPEFGTLVRYHLINAEPASGALCPDGTLVFLPPKELSAWPARGVVKKAMADEASRRSAAVNRLLANQ